MSERPLLRVSATRFRASASGEEERKSDILIEMKREAAPPIPIALTVLEVLVKHAYSRTEAQLGSAVKQAADCTARSSCEKLK